MPTGGPYSPFFPSARTFAHLALAAAESLALTSGLLRQSFFLVFGVAVAPLTLAHLAVAAAAIAALPAALKRLLPFFAIPFLLAHRIFRALAKAFINFRL